MQTTSPARERSAYIEGYEARSFDQQPYSACPYYSIYGTLWREGWRDANVGREPAFVELKDWSSD